MPFSMRASLPKLIRVLRHFGPIVCRGVALGFAILAISTAFFGMGDYATSETRYFLSGFYALVAAASFAASTAIEPFLRWILRRL